jgi:hypothetical protein
LLQPGQTVIELTSGNTGTGLAIVCAARGYRFIAVMSTGNSIERARMMKALGAEVVLVDQCPESTPGQVSGADLELVNQRAMELTSERNASNEMLFEQTSSNWREAGARITTIPGRKSCNRLVISMLFAILSAPAVPLRAAAGISRKRIRLLPVLSSNRMVPPF